MVCSKGGCRHPFSVLFLVLLFTFDVFTDVATGVELILNDQHTWLGDQVVLLKRKVKHIFK
jgi:hypothetical protein